MSEQAETGDVGAGVNVLADWLHLLKQRVLAEGHAPQRSIQIRSFRGAAHGPGKQHPGPQGATD